MEIWTPVKPNAAVTRSFLYVHMHPKIANLKMSLKFLHVNFRDFLAIHAFSTCIHRKTTDILTIGFVADSPSTPGVVSMFLWLIIETLIQLTWVLHSVVFWKCVFKNCFKFKSTCFLFLTHHEKKLIILSWKYVLI